ncbi:MAG: ABC transporter ATP-binding protein [Bacillota bacterium]
MEERTICARGLCKQYDDIAVLKGIDLDVREGEIFALLGPNGAGKTTTLECLEGLRPYDGGHVSVAGIDPATHPADLFRCIGVQLQTGSLPQNLTVFEILQLMSAYHGVETDPTILGTLGLTDRANDAYGILSTGQKRRLDLALALAHRPRILFLDEPTAGLDVSSRLTIHRLIFATRDRGTTVVLSTHDMAEAEHLADRVAVLMAGRIVASGSPRDLTSSGAGLSKISVRTAHESVLTSPTFSKFERDGDYAVAFDDSPGPLVARLLEHVERNGDILLDLRVERPSLEERFLELVEEESA